MGYEFSPCFAHDPKIVGSNPTLASHRPLQQVLAGQCDMSFLLPEKTPDILPTYYGCGTSLDELANDHHLAQVLFGKHIILWPDPVHFWHDWLRQQCGERATVNPIPSQRIVSIYDNRSSATGGNGAGSTSTAVIVPCLSVAERDGFSLLATIGPDTDVIIIGFDKNLSVQPWAGELSVLSCLHGSFPWMQSLGWSDDATWWCLALRHVVYKHTFTRQDGRVDVTLEHLNPDPDFLPLLHPSQKIWRQRRAEDTRFSPHREYRCQMYHLSDLICKHTSNCSARNEFVCLSALTGPWFPRATAWGRFLGGTWVTTQLILGTPLSLLSPRALNREALISIIYQGTAILEVLDYRHVQHRDLWPHQFFLSESGTLFLLDFEYAVCAYDTTAAIEVPPCSPTNDIQQMGRMFTSLLNPFPSAVQVARAMAQESPRASSIVNWCKHIVAAVKTDVPDNTFRMD